MKHSAKFYLLVSGGVFLLLAVLLFCFSRWAPLLLLASLAVQLPIVRVVAGANMGASYTARALERRARYTAGGDAEAWLAAEEREAGGIGYKYWSRGAKALCTLNRAEALAALGRGGEAAELLAALNKTGLSNADRARLDGIVAAIRAPLLK